jgi:hypothetical protein
MAGLHNLLKIVGEKQGDFACSEESKTCTGATLQTAQEVCKRETIA